MRLENKIYFDALSILSDNKAGLTFDELFNRLTRTYKSLTRKYLVGIVGRLFRNDKIQSYKLDGLKLLQIK